MPRRTADFSCLPYGCGGQRTCWKATPHPLSSLSRWQRLQDGEPGIRLIEWLNGLPEVSQILAAGFGGREISEQNLSEWRAGGYQDWLARQETLACARELAGDAGELAEAADGLLADQLAVVLSARYAALVSGWEGEMDDEFRRKARALRTLCQDIVELRRDDHCAGRLRLDLDRFAEANKADEIRALEAVIEEVKEWPDVRQAFQDAFALLRQRKAGKPSTHPPPAGTTAIRPDQTESNRIKAETSEAGGPPGL